ncbi:hypothetical protein BSK59_08455 [Paenibacillus odorifer]|uniref:hypothetical protein n=1 Tax=Paenibacillus TaxID=44249 RepID=UPI00096C01C7|nr:hypothetical protein [Paenibacillus odorifer]OME58205.1 hypothetical protein BSK59_08455 [Paenibacillus odorifer]
MTQRDWQKELGLLEGERDQYKMWHLDEEKRANDAEAREQQLKAFVEKLREENSAHDFYYGGIHEECNDILSTLYPDTPAPKEGSHET